MELAYFSGYAMAMQSRGGALPAITAEDAAFAQMLMRIHELQEDPLLLGGLLETAATIGPTS